MGINRRSFIANLALLTGGASLTGLSAHNLLHNPNPVSAFCKRLKPVGRALEMEGYYVWCNSPIEAPDGKIHVFFSRWSEKRGMGGWISACEIAHAIADHPEAPFQFMDVVLAPRGEGFWDATTCHNPFITHFNDTYYLFYMGNSNGKTNTKRIGVATSKSLYGPWERSSSPILEPGIAGAWDDHCTTNPAVLLDKDGLFRLYYKSWNTQEYLDAGNARIKGNRKYGLAFAKQPEGPYTKYEHNPVVDFSKKGNNTQLEDAFVWMEKGKYWMIARDMGVFSHDVGLIMHSKNGIHWSEPEIAFLPLKEYIKEPDPPKHLNRYGRLERPAILMKNGSPAYLFGASQGGKYMTSSAFIFKII
jgi:hypothetical protein